MTGRKGLSTNKDFVEIDIIGARISQLVLDGKTILNEVDRIDGGKGSTHPCTPNFGKTIQTKDYLPQHGPARNEEWKIVETQEKGVLELKWKIDSDKYPDFSGLEVRRRFELKDGVLIVETTHDNQSVQEIPVNFGEHIYFKTGQSGWEKLEINGKMMADKVRENKTIDLEEMNIIKGLIPLEIVLKQQGLPKAVLWTGEKNGEYDNHYVCIEPVEGEPDTEKKQGFFGSEASMIKPGNSKTTKLEISLKS